MRPPPPPRGEADYMRLTVIYNIIHVRVTENIYQLHYLVTAVPPENRTTPKKILNLQKTIIQRPIY